MLDVDFREFEKLSRALDQYEKAIPYAIQEGLNRHAFAVRQEWQRGIRTTFTLRNPFTERSIRVDRATSLIIPTMQARVGSVAPYMGDQEEGATVRGRGKHKAIPLATAAGQGHGAKRTKLVRSRYKLGAINVPTQAKGRGLGRRRQNAVAISVALRKGARFVLLNRTSKRGRGLFEVTGGKRKARTRFLWDVSRGSVTVPATRTLKNAIDRVHPKAEDMYLDAIRKQLKRHRVFGY